jgi:hypothetical protein
LALTGGFPHWQKEALVVVFDRGGRAALAVTLHLWLMTFWPHAHAAFVLVPHARAALYPFGRMPMRPYILWAACPCGPIEKQLSRDFKECQ